MRKIAEIFYKVYLKGEHERFEPEAFDEVQQKFMKSLSGEQYNLFRQLETFYFDIVAQHSVSLIEYIFDLIVDDEFYDG